jgi:hypothetical protein
MEEVHHLTTEVFHKFTTLQLVVKILILCIFFRNSIHLIQFSVPSDHCAMNRIDGGAISSNSCTVGFGLDNQLTESDRESCV